MNQTINITHRPAAKVAHFRWQIIRTEHKPEFHPVHESGRPDGTQSGPALTPIAHVLGCGQTLRESLRNAASNLEALFETE